MAQDDAQSQAQQQTQPQNAQSGAPAQSSPHPQAAHLQPSLPQTPQPIADLPAPADPEKPIRVHYYVKIAVCTFLCALLLLVGVPVFMESRVTGSLAYTALGVVMVAFGLVLALAVLVLLFRPPFRARIGK